MIGLAFALALGLAGLIRLALYANQLEKDIQEIRDARSSYHFCRLRSGVCTCFIGAGRPGSRC